MNIEIIGFFLPPVIDLINRRVTNSTARFWIALLFCTLIATLFNLEKLEAKDVNGLLASIAIVFTQAQIVYKAYWEKSDVRTKFIK